MTDPIRKGKAAILLVGLFLSVLGTSMVGDIRPVSASPPSGSYFDHVVIIMMEDHGINQICGHNPPPCLSTNGDPYTAGLANTYGIGSQYLGVSHFSQADYVAVFGGDTLGCVAYPCQTSSAPNIIDRLEAGGLTWKGYMENQALTSGCDSNTNQPYTSEHNPFVFFTDITNNPSRCSNIHLPNPTSCTVTDCTLINDLNSPTVPNFMWLTPNNCDNMHGATGICATSIPAGDTYLSGLVPNILNSRAFTTTRSALFVVFDEGNGYCPLNGSSEDCVYAVWAGPGTKTGFVTTNFYNHYSLTKTIETNWNLPSLTSNDASATPMSEFFTTTSPPPLSTSFTFSPSSPIPGQTVTFTGTATGGTGPYAFNWNFGDGIIATGNPVTHAYSASGSYTVTLTTSDSASHTATFSNSVPVSNASFKLTANPSLLTVQRGQNSQSQIVVTSTGGFKGTVSLTASVSPPGITVSMQNPSVTLNTGQTVNDNLKVTVSKTAPTGIFIATVTATSGALVHALNVTVRVPDFNMTANPNALSIPPGSSGTSQILFQSLYTFQGGISTSISVSPAMPKPTLNPNNPTLAINGTATSILTVQVPSNQAPGVYNVTIKATSGSLTHSLVIQIHVGQHSTTTIVNCSPSSEMVSQPSTCTATVTDTSTIGPTTPTGTVTFSETGPAGSFSSTICTLSSGICSVTFTPKAPGTATIIGTYSGDSSHNGSTSTSTSIIVSPRTTSTIINCTGPVVVNQASSCTATVSDTSPGTPMPPTGFASFNATGTTGSFNSVTCTLNSGNCSVMFTPTATGTAMIQGAYGGDGAHSASTSSPASVTVNKRTTSTVISCTSPVVVYQNSNCTATITVSSNGGTVTPTGNVTFVSDSPGTFSAIFCNLTPVSGGVAGCNVSYTPNAAGTDTITGTYSGDTVHLASSDSSTITAGLRSTGTALTCLETNSTFNQSCAATVTDNSPGTIVTPTGTVSFTTDSSGTFTPSTCTLSGTGTPGVASCSVAYTSFAITTQTITGAYSGDTVHLASQGSTTISLGTNPTTTAVSCSPSSVTINQATTCTVTVNDTEVIGPTSPTGTVSFSGSGPGTFNGAPCTLVSQTITSSSCTVSYTPTGGAGTQTITATYDGDTTHKNSSQGSNLTVTLRSTLTTVTCNPNNVVVNQATNCTATVSDTSGSGATIPTGTIAFSPGGPCLLVNGTCSLSITPSSSGSLSITASYGGDSEHNPSSGNTTITVNNRATSTTVSCSPNPVANITATNCTATVTDSDIGTLTTPSGSVGFTSNSTGTFSQANCTLTSTGNTGVASCSVNYTPGRVGSHAITGSYAGDSSHLASNGGLLLTVNPSAPKPSYALVVSNDGRVYRLYQNGTLTLIGQPVLTALRSIAWKPDGSYALISGDSAVLLKYDGTWLTVIPTGISTGFNFWTVSWKPDGSYALIGGTSGTLFKYDGTSVTTIPNTSTTILSISWNPSGSYALLVGKSGLALTYDGTSVRSFATGTTFDLDAAAWNPNGVYALIGGLNRTLLQFNGAQVTAINTSIISPNAAIRAVSFNPLGTLALLAGDNGMVLAYNGSTLTMLPSITSSWLYTISWSPSGTAYIAGGSGTILAYNNGTLSKLSTTPSTTLQFRALAWKPQ